LVINNHEIRSICTWIHFGFTENKRNNTVKKMVVTKVFLGKLEMKHRGFECFRGIRPLLYETYILYKIEKNFNILSSWPFFLILLI
jgi:hypothetical protein